MSSNVVVGKKNKMIGTLMKHGKRHWSDAISIAVQQQQKQNIEKKRKEKKYTQTHNTYTHKMDDLA